MWSFIALLVLVAPIAHGFKTISPLVILKQLGTAALATGLVSLAPNVEFIDTMSHSHKTDVPTLTVGIPTANAAVGEGGLPEGVLAFNKLLKYQKDWDSVADSVQKRGKEMEQNEILSVKLFLKQLANEYNDMILLSKGVTDTDNQNKAKEIAKDIKVKMKKMDDALTNNDLQVLLDNYPSTKQGLIDFFGYLQDVPDEL